MSKVSVNPSDVAKPTPAGSYSKSVRVGNLIFTSGITATDASGNVIGKGDIRAQAQQVFENIRRVLASQSATMDDAVKRTIYLKDVGDLPEVYKVMAEYFRDSANYPACACVQVSGLSHPDYLLEVDVVAEARE